MLPTIQLRLARRALCNSALVGVRVSTADLVSAAGSDLFRTFQSVLPPEVAGESSPTIWHSPCSGKGMARLLPRFLPGRGESGGCVHASAPGRMRS